MKGTVVCSAVALGMASLVGLSSTIGAPQDPPAGGDTEGKAVKIEKRSSLNLAKFAEDLRKSMANAPAAPIVPRAIHTPRGVQIKGRGRAGGAGNVAGRGAINVAEAAKDQARAPAPDVAPRAIAPPRRPEAAKAKAKRETSPAPDPTFVALQDLGTSIPADTHGAVGPDHLLVALNTEVGFQDRDGNPLHRLTLTNFWSSVTNAPTDVVFDPKVLYDPSEKRWVFIAPANPESSASALLIGASRTSDPTGDWTLYRIAADPDGKLWFDYPSVGINRNWVVVQGNMFAISQNSRDFRSQIYVFNKADLFAGGDDVGVTLLTRDDLGLTQAPEVNLDNTTTMSLIENPTEDGNKTLKLYRIVGEPKTPRLQAGSKAVELPNSWNFSPPNDEDFAPQKGTSHKFQDDDARALGVVSRGGQLYFVHTAFLPGGGTSTRSAIQWAQIDPNAAAPLKQFGRIDDQDQTGGDIFRGFPSIAVNKNGDVLIGYSRFHNRAFAGSAYALRKKGDPDGQFRKEVIFRTGRQRYFKTFGRGQNRWGDYSNTVVDPVNDLDFWTIQIFADRPDGQGDHWGTQWARVKVSP